MTEQVLSIDQWHRLKPGDKIRIDWVMPWEGDEVTHATFEELQHTANEFGRPVTYVITDQGGLADTIIDRVTLIEEAS